MFVLNHRRQPRKKFGIGTFAILTPIRGQNMAGATGIKMENGQQLVVAGYADDVIIMAGSEEDLKRTTS